ncbi:hypothetical protein EV663_10543 [Rhodovulum bhavnagarense]|uniref:Uncharacterized protein n=1 Tax=Rhodovulum bhavnagarense TaxID=992286 RepID=A0A4R2RQ62_9RHOB|nr:hypothetical protein [Rhodovulum bhavnagarense]TCP61325.1 hypothetical protein EV663_10543 [Rhodovulum bhavnagarense]
MWLFLSTYFLASLALLLGATELERRAIVARKMWPNGKAFLFAIAFSAIVSLFVTVAAAYASGWVSLLHVLGLSILYHGFMGIFLVHGLQRVSARVACQAMA